MAKPSAMKQRTKIAVKKKGTSKVTKTSRKASKGRSRKADFSQQWTRAEEAVLNRLKTPHAIQRYLDSLTYDAEDGAHSVRSTLRTRKAHCMGGALLAAYCLKRIGLGPPRLVSIDSHAEVDDGHVIAVYKLNGHWGAIAKSNFTCIRARDPVYRTIRELMMSYFDFYFNSKGVKSMLGYSPVLNVERFSRAQGKDKSHRWLFAEDIVKELDKEKVWQPYFKCLPRGMRTGTLLPASKALLDAGLLGSNPAGLHKC
eukprot:gnl/TRDRNA2_/TRDRNA2_147697_c0_seq2.p1 gnl/TRDRNA2_/TRDRNA2_147697_c0~~gnl/TRDRNA2_/TRDRNA2_147697_c0_seq2.p1  ORF type:complete len:256 (+),score=44.46 gnl/TRDRNA2_/TRDRNA2_147697_c0_seq2:90-857(+)